MIKIKGVQSFAGLALKLRETVHSLTSNIQYRQEEVRVVSGRWEIGDLCFSVTTGTFGEPCQPEGPHGLLSGLPPAGGLQQCGAEWESQAGGT